MEADWGDTVAPEKIEAALKRTNKPRIVGIVHAETSTGALQSIPDIADVVHAAEGLLLVDCVTSLGGLPVEIDQWGIDAAYSGTQKCLGCPPGLAPVTFSSRAMQAIEGRSSKVGSWYLDVTMLRSYWSSDRAYHHTAPINANYGLHEALRAGLEAIGVRYSVAEGCRLPMLNSVWIPEGVDDVAVRRRLLDEFNIEIGGGLGPMKGRTWRIGLMGEASRCTNVLLFLAALERCLLDQSVELQSGAGVAAASAMYAST